MRRLPPPRNSEAPSTPVLVGAAILLFLTCSYWIGVRHAALIAQTDAWEIAWEDATVCSRLVITTDQRHCAEALNAVRGRERIRNRRDSEAF